MTCEKVYHANEQKKEIVNHKDCRKARIGEMPPPKKTCFTLCTSVRWIYSQWSEVSNFFEYLHFAYNPIHY